jgi:hypothetical protein
MNESLCHSCVFAKEIVSGKGSRFLLCEKSHCDRRFEKYPQQPVVRCEGFAEKKPGDANRGDPAATEPVPEEKT